MAPGRPDPLRTWPEFELPVALAAAATDPLGLDRRLLLIPAAELLVTIPSSNDRVVLHHLDRGVLTAWSSPGAVTVTSHPPPAVRRGEALAYRITTRPSGVSMAYSVADGPPGLRVLPDGLVTWQVPADQALGAVRVVVLIRSPEGAEARHEFRLVVAERGAAKGG
jgi:hypothetical protein